jgi:hypothetical protein
MKSCTKCGKQNNEGDVFCRFCGERFDGAGSSSGINEKDLALFIGKNSDKYLEKFRNFNLGGEDRYAVGWHWPAFFFSFWWTLYRKMYGWAVLVLFLSIVPYLGFLTMIVFAMSANYLYYRHAKNKVLELKAQPGTEIEKAAAVARAGGVNNVVIFLIPAGIAVAGIIAAIAIPQFVNYRQQAFELKAKQEIQQACSVGETLFKSNPEKTLIEPDDLLYAGLVRTPEVEMMLLDGRREYFSISARHVKGKKTYFTDPHCALSIEEDAPGNK